MPLPTVIPDLSATAASNYPAGSDAPNVIDDTLRAHAAFIRQLINLGSDIASASTITPVATASVFNVTGTTTITAIGSTNSWDGRVVSFIFAGALTLTHSSNLAMPGAVNFTTAANDVASFVQTASGTWRCVVYQRASGAIGAGASPATGYMADIAGTVRSIGGEASAAGYSYRLLNATQNGGGHLTAGAGLNGGVVLSGDAGPIIFTVVSSVPTLGTNGHMATTLTSDTNLRISVRGSDGVTRVVNLTLA